MDKFSEYYSQGEKSVKGRSYPVNSPLPISERSTPQEMSDFVMRNVKGAVEAKIKAQSSSHEKSPSRKKA